MPPLFLVSIQYPRENIKIKDGKPAFRTGFNVFPGAAVHLLFIVTIQHPAKIIKITDGKLALQTDFYYFRGADKVLTDFYYFRGADKARSASGRPTLRMLRIRSRGAE